MDVCLYSPTCAYHRGSRTGQGPEGDGTPPKKRRKKVVTNDDEEEGSREERATSSVHRPVDSSIGVDGNVSVSSPKKKAVDGDVCSLYPLKFTAVLICIQRSDSGMSVLIDEVEPTRKRKKNDTTAVCSIRSFLRPSFGFNFSVSFQ